MTPADRTSLRIFLSYGHDEYAEIAERIQHELEKRGHEVWFDRDRLLPGTDWESRIEQGIGWVADDRIRGRVVLVMTPHSVRRPDGYCLNEIARALDRRLRILPVMLVWVEPPLSINRIQWLDMQSCVPLPERNIAFLRQCEVLTQSLESDRADFQGLQSRLLAELDPIPFDEEFAHHLPRFFGRVWVDEAIDRWLAAGEGGAKIFWIVGPPGIGKTALAVHLASTRREVAAWHFCRFGHSAKADPFRCVKSIVYQLAMQLPDYRDYLAGLNISETLASSDTAATLFDLLLLQPLANLPAPDRTILVIVDALDEASRGGRNELAEFLAEGFPSTPRWLRLIATSRRDPAVTSPLQGYTPLDIDSDAGNNERDLADFLRTSLEPYNGGNPLPENVIKVLLSHAQGNFLYAESVRSELELGRLSFERLGEFPQGLGAAYAKFFRRLFPDIGQYAQRVRPLLEMMSAALGPLPTKSPGSELKWTSYEENQIFSDLGSLYRQRDGYVEPFHQSLTDWLTDREKAGLYWVSPREGNARLAHVGWSEFQGGVPAMSDYTMAHLAVHLIEAGRTIDAFTLLTNEDYLSRRLLLASSVPTLEGAKAYDILGNPAPGRSALRVGFRADLVRAALLWPKAENATPVASALAAFSEAGWKMMPEDYDEAKGILGSAVYTVLDIVRARPDLISLVPYGAPVRIRRFLESRASEEGFMGDCSRAHLCRAIATLREYVRSMNSRLLANWLAEWDHIELE